MTAKPSRGQTGTVSLSFCPSVLVPAAGPWCSSAAATDTPAGGVRASRASSGITGGLSSETTASAPSHRNRRTSRPNGKTTGGGDNRHLLVRGGAFVQTSFELLFSNLRKKTAKADKHLAFSVPLRGRYGNVGTATSLFAIFKTLVCRFPLSWQRPRC